MHPLIEKLKKQPFMATCRWPLFVLLFVCFGAAILGDSTAEALLLAHFDAHLIPTMFLVNAAFLFLMSAFMMSLIDRVDRGTFFLVLTLCHGCVLVLIRILVMMHAEFLYLPLFSYAYVTKILLFLMFWTLANDLVDSRRASREFPVIAAGGTFGAILISFAIPSFLKVIAAENLLVIWAVLSLALGVLFVPFKAVFGAAFKPSSDKQKREPRSLKSIIDDLRLVKNEPLLRNMAVFYFFLFFILLNQHFVFYSQLKKYLSDARSLGSFLGYFNGTSMFVTFVLQIGVAGIILKKIGSTRSMMFLPAVLCCVFAVLTAIGSVCGGNPGPHTVASQWLFWSIVAGMGLRVAFFDSFFSPNFQVFFSSLPQEVRGRGKLAIEGVIKPAAIIFASIMMLVVLPVVPFSVTMALLFCVSGGVLAQTFRIRKKYAQSLTAYLTGFRSKKLPALFNLVDIPDTENFVGMLAMILEKEEYEIKKFIIEILAGMNSVESIDVLVKYLDVADGHARATVISSLAPLHRDDLKGIFSRFLNDKDERVTANCILALSLLTDAETQEGIEAFLLHTNNRVKANSVVAVWRRAGTDRRRDELFGILSTMLLSPSDEDRASALYALGEIRFEKFMPVAREFIGRERDRIFASPSVRRQLVNALAKIQSEESFDLILALSQDNHAKLHNDLSYAIGLLIDNGYPVARCMERVKEEQHVRRGVILKALYAKAGSVGKEFDYALEDVAHAEAGSVYSDWLSLCALDTKAVLPEVGLLRTAIYEVCILEKLRNLIYLAALCDRTGQIGSIMQRLYHPNRHVRARAFEVLDNVGNVKVNRWLISLLDTDDAVTHGREATISFKHRARPLIEAVSLYAGGSGEWLHTCALYAAHALFESTGDNRWMNLYNKGSGSQTHTAPVH
jgi:ATP/ADP translocase